MRTSRFRLVLAGLFATAIPAGAAEAAKSGSAETLTLIVMDPLALPLSCPCVEGYAQRDYDKLGEYLAGRLHRQVEVVFSESLSDALKRKTEGRADLIIGKRSVVEYDAAESKLPVTPIASLTGKDGSTTQTGLIVVPSGDPARSAADLKGYRILFGPTEAQEKHAAAAQLLKDHGVAVPALMETCEGCAEGATIILKAGKSARGAAVISSYARPLLEGCGTVKKGDLRVVGETAPVPFITAFATQRLDGKLRQEIQSALFSLIDRPELAVALETQRGFVPISAEAQTAKKKLNRGPTHRRWTGWRGPRRDGRVEWLPASLPKAAAFVWTRPMQSAGVGGLAADQTSVYASDREADDSVDVFLCLDAATGEERWSFRHPAVSNLDYGNSPRATPLLEEGFVVFFGAMGGLHCIERSTGDLVWQKELATDFGAVEKLVWGMCSSPLVVDGKLIVNPGTKEAGLAALDLKTGEVVWKSPTNGRSHGSFIVGAFGGVRQIIGYDRDSLGGWDPNDGRRLWRIVPPFPNDFNVPTPIDCGGRLLVATENNGTRLYRFHDKGVIDPEPIARFEDLAPDAHTPVTSAGRVFGVWRELYCLDLATLRKVWVGVDDAFHDYCSLVASDDRVLATTLHGELILWEARSSEFRPTARLKLFPDDRGVYSHPAIVGSRLFLRSSDAACCLSLEESPTPSAP